MRYVLLFLAIALGGCVSSGRHRALEQEYAETKASLLQQIEERDQRLTELEQELAAARLRHEELQAELDDRNAQIETLEQDIIRLEQEHAFVLNDRARLRASAEELRAVLQDAAERRREAEQRVAEFRNLLDRFKSMIDSGALKVKLERGRMMLELPSDVLFASGSAQLSAQGQSTIDDVAAVLKTIPDREFQVEGHTDSVPISNERYASNWHLGAARALVVVDRMLKQGVNKTHLSAASFGEYRPVASNELPEGKAANRRIEIVIVPDLASLPGTDEIEAILHEK